MLEIKNFSKSYGSAKKAVDNLSFTVNDGAIVGFMGRNGAGKTTTLKAVVGIHSIEEGEIIINGKSVKSAGIECKKEIAYIPDNPDLYEHLSGIKYLNFIADIFCVDKKEREERIHKYADIFEITSALSSTIASYSHGMKQKIAIIAALIHNPKLIIMDEPFVGLDPIASHEVKKIMREFCDNGGSILFSTHILEVAEKICDSVVIIKDGVKVFDGTVNEFGANSSLENVFMELSEE